MKKTIDELATEYIQELAGTNPNADLSAFSDDYRAFVAGANSVKICLIADVGGSLRELADKYEMDALDRYHDGDHALSHLHMASQARYGFEDGWKAAKKQ